MNIFSCKIKKNNLNLEQKKLILAIKRVRFFCTDLNTSHLSKVLRMLLRKNSSLSVSIFIIRVLLDPRPELGNPGVNSWTIPVSTPDAPTDDSGELEPAVAALDDERSA